MKAVMRALSSAAALALFGMVAFAQGEPLGLARLTPEELKWSFTPTGAQRADLAGDERKPGMYVYRVRFPANYKVQPHWHPDERVVLVISGTLSVGYGEQFEEGNLKELPAGSFFTEPPKQPHFVWAKTGEVIIQVTGMGPSGRTPVPPTGEKR